MSRLQTSQRFSQQINDDDDKNELKQFLVLVKLI